MHPFPELAAQRSRAYILSTTRAPRPHLSLPRAQEAAGMVIRPAPTGLDRGYARVPALASGRARRLFLVGLRLESLPERGVDRRDPGSRAECAAGCRLRGHAEPRATRHVPPAHLPHSRAPPPRPISASFSECPGDLWIRSSRAGRI